MIGNECERILYGVGGMMNLLECVFSDAEVRM